MASAFVSYQHRYALASVARECQRVSFSAKKGCKKDAAHPHRKAETRWLAGKDDHGAWIATRDRRERKAERLDAAKARAMLVLIDVSALFARVANAKFKVTNRLGPTLKVVEPATDRDSLVARNCPADP
jgi:hypothetical protein